MKSKFKRKSIASNDMNNVQNPPTNKLEKEINKTKKKKLIRKYNKGNIPEYELLNQSLSQHHKMKNGPIHLV